FKNRFLDMFSRPMIERPAFMGREWPTNTKGISTAGRYGDDNRVTIQYASFDLLLPREAKVSRISEGKIEIDTPDFSDL
ncbi:MAG TPA: hypothetical protein VLQ80_22835, partial [Candidatus Saccharimonadia bacterium]|nr:hypothetical protein [Candidatus Saccharimonadia bacterium]